jgi:hypothetical protein
VELASEAVHEDPVHRARESVGEWYCESFN